MSEKVLKIDWERVLQVSIRCLLVLRGLAYQYTQWLLENGWSQAKVLAGRIYTTIPKVASTVQRANKYGVSSVKRVLSASKTYLVAPLFFFFIAPLYIVISAFLELMLLPINLPLKVIFGISLRNLMDPDSLKINFLTAQVIVQYSIAMIIFGLVVGGFVGLVLGVTHSLIRFKDRIIEIPDVVGTIKEYAHHIMHAEEVEVLAPFEDKVGDISKLPSDFFQSETGSEYDVDEYGYDTNRSPPSISESVFSMRKSSSVGTTNGEMSIRKR